MGGQLNLKTVNAVFQRTS